MGVEIWVWGYVVCGFGCREKWLWLYLRVSISVNGCIVVG